MYRLYASTTPFYIRDLSIQEFLVFTAGPETSTLQIPRDNRIYTKGGKKCPCKLLQVIPSQILPLNEFTTIGAGFF